MEDIKNKIDVHQYTADIIGVSRQDAKAHTFKPLYGGTTGTEEEKNYYRKFAEKYKDILDKKHFISSFFNPDFKACNLSKLSSCNDLSLSDIARSKISTMSLNSFS